MGYSSIVSKDGARTATVTGTAMIAPIRAPRPTVAPERNFWRLIAECAEPGLAAAAAASPGVVVWSCWSGVSATSRTSGRDLPGSITADPAALRNADASATNCKAPQGLSLDPRLARAVGSWERPGRVPPGFRPLRGLRPALRCALRPLAKASRLRLRGRSTPEILLRAHGVHANRWIQA